MELQAAVMEMAAVQTERADGISLVELQAAVMEMTAVQTERADGISLVELQAAVMKMTAGETERADGIASGVGTMVVDHLATCREARAVGGSVMTAGQVAVPSGGLPVAVMAVWAVVCSIVVVVGGSVVVVEFALAVEVVVGFALVVEVAVGLVAGMGTSLREVAQMYAAVPPNSAGLPHEAEMDLEVGEDGPESVVVMVGEFEAGLVNKSSAEIVETFVGMLAERVDLPVVDAVRVVHTLKMADALTAGFVEIAFEVGADMAAGILETAQNTGISVVVVVVVVDVVVVVVV